MKEEKIMKKVGLDEGGDKRNGGGGLNKEPI